MDYFALGESFMSDCCWFKNLSSVSALASVRTKLTAVFFFCALSSSSLWWEYCA